MCVLHFKKGWDVLLPFFVFGGKEDGEVHFFSFRPFSQLAPKSVSVVALKKTDAKKTERNVGNTEERGNKRRKKEE